MARSPRRAAARVGLGVVVGTYLLEALTPLFPEVPGVALLVAGAVAGLVVGLLTVGRLGLARGAFGFAVGAVAATVVNPAVAIASSEPSWGNAEPARYGYQPVVTLLVAGAFGAALGLVAHRRPRLAKPLSGLAFGMVVGQLASLAATTGDGWLRAEGLDVAWGGLLRGTGHAENFISGYGFGQSAASLMIVAAIAALGLLLGVVAEWRGELVRPALGLGLGAAVGGLGVAAHRSVYATFVGPVSYDEYGEPSGVGSFAGVGYFGDVTHGWAVMAGGAVAGLVVGLLAQRWRRSTVPLTGVALGAVLGHVVGAGLRSGYRLFGEPDAVRWLDGSGGVGTAISFVVGYGQGQVVAIFVVAGLGGVAGLLASRRLALVRPLAGLVLGVSTGGTVFGVYWNFVHLGGSIPSGAEEARAAAVGLVFVVLGLGAGVFAGWFPRLVKPSLGLALGALAGSTVATASTSVYLYVVDFDYNAPSDSRWAGIFGLAGGAAAGLVFGALADRRTRLGAPLLGLVLGFLASAAVASGFVWGLLDTSPFGSDELGYVVAPAVGIGVGTVVGLLAGALATRRPRQGRRMLGGLAGVVAGAAFQPVWLVVPPAVVLVLCAAGGVVVAAGGAGRAWAPSSAGGVAVRSSLPARQVARLVRGLRPGTLAHGLVGLAAAIASVDGQQARYSEEFEATIAEIGGRLHRTRRLWCALTILAGSALLRAELARRPRG